MFLAPASFKTFGKANGHGPRGEREGGLGPGGGVGAKIADLKVSQTGFPPVRGG